MTQAIALLTPAAPAAAAAMQTAGATVDAGEGFAAALAQLFGLATPVSTQASPQANTNTHPAKPQHASRSNSISNDAQPDAALVITPISANAATQVQPLPVQASSSAQDIAANPIAAYATALAQALASKPNAANATPIGQSTPAADQFLAPADQSATPNGQAAALGLPTQLLAAQLAALPAAPPVPAQTKVAVPAQASSENAAKVAQRPAAAKHAPAAPVGGNIDSAGNDTQPISQKSAYNTHLAVAVQRALNEGTNGNAAQSGGGKTDAAPSQMAAAAAQFVANAHVSSAAQAAPALITTPSMPIPLDALAVHIARKFESGESRFEIRLDPIELGKLDISVTVGDDGRVQAVLRAERPETLDLLQRDARLLEGQLRQAGLGVDSNSLNFSLGGGTGQRQALANGAQGFAQALGIAPEIEPITTTTAIVSLRDGVDIRI